MEVEPLDHTKLEDLGLNTCNHDIPLSYREIPSVDEPEPKPLPNLTFLCVNLGDKRGTDPPINPYSPGSFRMKARILELKRRNMNKTDSDILYAVFIKEDTVYQCLHFAKDDEGTRSNTPYPENSIRRIQDIEGSALQGVWRTHSTFQRPGTSIIIG
ncbi:hypothetical protein Tco_0168399 [Tanacetum coccineum]